MPSVVRHALAGLLLAASTIGTSLASHYQHRQPAAVHAHAVTRSPARTASCASPRTRPHAATRPVRAVRPAAAHIDKPGLLGRVGHWVNQRIYAGWHLLTRSVLHPGPSRNTTLVDRP